MTATVRQLQFRPRLLPSVTQNFPLQELSPKPDTMTSLLTLLRKVRDKLLEYTMLNVVSNSYGTGYCAYTEGIAHLLGVCHQLRAETLDMRLSLYCRGYRPHRFKPDGVPKGCVSKFTRTRLPGTICRRTMRPPRTLAATGGETTTSPSQNQRWTQLLAGRTR